MIVTEAIVFRKLNEHSRNLTSIRDQVKDHQTQRLCQRLRQEVCQSASLLNQRKIILGNFNIFLLNRGSFERGKFVFQESTSSSVSWSLSATPSGL